MEIIQKISIETFQIVLLVFTMMVLVDLINVWTRGKIKLFLAKGKKYRQYLVASLIPVGLILGGFHMKDCLTEQYVNITHYFRMLQPQSIGACHCTGLEKFAEMRSECESHIFYNYTGNMVNI